MKLCLIAVSAVVLSTVCGCASSLHASADLGAIHSANLNNAIDRAAAKQEKADRAVVKPLRVGTTKYNFHPYYLPGTDVVLSDDAPFNPNSL